MSKDTEIQALWNKVAEVLNRELGKDEVSPHMVQAAIRFLKDNEVETLPVKSNEIEELVRKLPFPFKKFAPEKLQSGGTT